MCEIALSPFVLRMLKGEFYRWEDRRFCLQFIAPTEEDRGLVKQLLNAPPKFWAAVKKITVDGRTWIVDTARPAIVESPDTTRVAICFAVTETSKEKLFGAIKEGAELQTR